jgi:hypothetical protein
MWQGYTQLGNQKLRLMWNAAGVSVGGWSAVPGFDSLFVQGSCEDARQVCSAVFIDRPIRWVAMDAALAA